MSHGEFVDPIALAERILDQCDDGHADPDSDIAILARQLLRANERIARLTSVQPPADAAESCQITKNVCASHLARL